MSGASETDERTSANLYISIVTSAAELSIVKSLFEQYWSSFGFTPCFQGFASEVANLPGSYAPPAGRLALATVGGEAAGCVAMRGFDAYRCEAKRLFVKPEFRGRGIGRALVEWLMSEARAAGYSEMLGDTLPIMAEALAIYDRLGFERTAPYGERPTPGAIYLRLKL